MEIKRADIRKNFTFNSGPFEQYVAENEPDILNYAVAPPYFEVSKKRALTPSTHILFGARGSGKSATRLSTEKELWRKHSEGETVPLAVPLIDFSRLLDDGSIEDVSSDGLIKELAFAVLETLLLWMSDQEEGAEIVDMLEPDEITLVLALTQSFYLPVPEANRRVSQESAMRLLQQNWKSRSVKWINRKWSEISKLTGVVSSRFLEKNADTGDLSREIAFLLTEDGALVSGTAVLRKLVEISETFGFSGISVFVDKVDEHPKTQSSPESCAKLIHPLLAHVQLMEVEGLGWQFFLWDRIREHLVKGELKVRLDKIAHSEVAWTTDFLQEMIDARIKFFSSGSLCTFAELGEGDFQINTKISEAIELATNSPREIIRLLDTVTREFDAVYAGVTQIRHLSEADLDSGMDKYVSDVIWAIYDRDALSQILRLNKTTFINKEVQKAFKLSAPGATNRILKWEMSGAITLRGTRAAEGGAGGKPANEYAIADPRIIRLSDRKLYDENVLTEAPIDIATTA